MSKIIYMRHSLLPERLEYLQPFRKKFRSQAAEALNEDSGSAVLMPLFTKRLRGLSLQEAEEVLTADFEALQKWLSEAAQQDDPLQFVLGFSLVASPQELAKHIKEQAEKPPEPRLCLHMELPPGAKPRRIPGGREDAKIVTLRGLWLAMDALDEHAVSNFYDASLRNATTEAKCEVTLTCGPVTGRKLTITGQDKEVVYALAVPGGHVFGSLSAVGKKANRLIWEEAPFESCFHTLRVESKILPSV